MVTVATDCVVLDAAGAEDESVDDESGLGVILEVSNVEMFEEAVLMNFFFFAALVLRLIIGKSSSSSPQDAGASISVTD